MQQGWAGLGNGGEGVPEEEEDHLSRGSGHWRIEGKMGSRPVASYTQTGNEEREKLLPGFKELLLASQKSFSRLLLSLRGFTEPPKQDRYVEFLVCM